MGREAWKGRHGKAGFGEGRLCGQERAQRRRGGEREAVERRHNHERRGGERKRWGREEEGKREKLNGKKIMERQSEFRAEKRSGAVSHDLTRNSKSARQLVQNTWAGMLSLSSGPRAQGLGWSSYQHEAAPPQPRL